MAFNCTEILSNNKLVRFLRETDYGCTNYVMKSGEGKKKITKFKYFRLYITATSGASTIQYTKLKFATSTGRVFSYWDGVESKTTIKNFVSATVNRGQAGAGGGESAEYGLLTDPKEGKCCWLCGSTISQSNPLIIRYELKTKTLDLSIYNKWSWYTANDTSSNRGRNITKFQLQVSNTAADDDWLTVDQNTDPANIKTTANWSLAYEHSITI